jgi:16S rRNA (uracil1498-N3)-methyltransferase
VNNIILSPQNASLVEHSVYRVTETTVLNHLTNILNLKAGQESVLNIVVPNEGRGVGRFYVDGHGGIFVEVVELNKTRKRNIHLAIATTRPLMAKRVLEHATTLGAASFNFFPAELSEKSYFSSKVYSDEVASQHIQKGMAQCSEFSTVPKLMKHRKLEDLIKVYADKSVDMYWLDKSASNYFGEPDVNKEIILFIGPERGWTKREIEIFQSSDIIGTKLSNSVMRVEFAVNAAFAQLEYIANRRSDV